MRGFVIGVALDGDENVYACDIKKHCVFKINRNGRVVEYCKSADGNPVMTPNYALFDDDGNLSFTDSAITGNQMVDLLESKLTVDTLRP